jgi:alkylated DNA repair dioxygenase AlkB
MCQQAGPPGGRKARAQVHWTEVRLDDVCTIGAGRMPPDVAGSEDAFERIWALHPPDFPQLALEGTLRSAPRWHQMYEHDYHFAGRLNEAVPLPELFAPLLAWARSNADPRFNGVLANWYDGAMGHYIAPHRDALDGLVAGAPILSISLGASRTIRFRSWTTGRMCQQLVIHHGDVLLIPYDTNLNCSHEVPHLPDDRGRRVSMTFRVLVDVQEP